MQKIQKRQQVATVVSSYEKQEKEKIVRMASDPSVSYRTLLESLEALIVQSTTPTDFNYRIRCFRNDGVYALNRAIEQVYGSLHAKRDSKMSGGEENLKTIDITLADGTRIKAPFGKFALPEAGEDAMIEIAYDTKKHELVVRGSCEYRFSSMIDSIVSTAKHLLLTSSIYANMAVEIGSDFMPQPIDLSNIDNQFMVLSALTEHSLKPLMSRVLNPEECLAAGIELKTGVLLEGDYGTGKTLLAFKVAKQAIENNWSFLYLKDPKVLAEVLRISKTLDNNGNGIIVFLEDVDQITQGSRDEALQDILNTLDGGDTKGMNVILICTTNHIKAINPTFLRGKRIGTIVSMGSLDAPTAREFIDHAFQNTNYDVKEEGNEEISLEGKLHKCTLDFVCQQVEKYKIVPAFLAEIVDRVKANMMFEEDKQTVLPEFLYHSVLSYLKQADLARLEDKTETTEKRLADSLRTVILEGSSIQELQEQVGFIRQQLS